MKLLVVLAAILVPALSAKLPYIVGGDDVAQPGAYPWQASIQTFGSHICGAAIISDRWLVTAAHCVGSAASSYTVVLGMHDRVTKRQGDPKTYRVSRLILHPDWVEDGNAGFPNDIALMYLSSRADLSGPYAQAVEMASSNEDFEGNNDCWITGWGKLSFLQGPPNVLQEAEVDVYSQRTCQATFGNVIKGYHICVGKQYVSGSCSGDSGGPLVCNVGGRYKLAGVTSFGVITCNTSVPSVYSRISYFRSWIQQNSGI